MTVTTGPTQPNPSHHIKLTDGTDSVGLVLVDGYGQPDVRGFQNNPLGQPVQITQGQSTYSDTVPPWESIEMKDFSGGFGAREFDNDKSKYYWGRRAYTHNSKFMIGGLPSWTGGLYKYWPYYFDGYVWHELNATNTKLAVQFTTTSTTDITYIHVVVKGTVTSLIASIRADTAGSPGALVGSISNFVPTDTDEYVLTISTGALTNATAYWLQIDGSGLAATKTARILCASSVNIADDVKKYVAATSTWTAIGTYRPFHVLGKRYGDNKQHFFEYKGAMFEALQFDDGTTAYLFLNGDQGCVKAGATATSVTSDSGITTWAEDEAIGSVFIITAGKGSTQPRNHRIIQDNAATSSTETTFDFTGDPWDVVPDATSEYAIVASNKWTFITPDTGGGTNPWTNKQVTNVLVVNNGVYFAHGDAEDMTRMRAYNSAGTWTLEWNVEAADSEATYLYSCSDASGNWIWKAKGGANAKVAKAPSVDLSGTGAAADLIWETEIGIDDIGNRITNILVYGEDYGQIHVLKEDGLYKIFLASDDSDYIGKIPISAFPATKDWRNGRAAVVHGTYLYLSWHDTVMRYYSGYIDNIGPNSQEMTVPADYRGIISALLSYPGMLVASIDAGDNGYSTVNAYNETGWCNLFTAPAKGLRIQNVYIQSIPGDNVDRLWISCADTSVWIPLSVNPAEHPELTYNGYKQAWDAQLQMGRMYAGRRMVNKYWNTLKWFMTNDSYGFTPSFNTYYTFRVIMYDGGIPGFPASPFNYEWDSADPTEESLTIPIECSGYLIMPKITMEMDDPDIHSIIESLLFEALSVDKIRRGDTLTVRIADRDKDLTGVDYDDYLTADEKLEQLTEWEQTPTALTMTSSVGLIDTKTVFIVRGGVRLVSISKDDMETKYILQLQVYET